MIGYAEKKRGKAFLYLFAIGQRVDRGAESLEYQHGPTSEKHSTFAPIRERSVNAKRECNCGDRDPGRSVGKKRQPRVRDSLRTWST